MEQHGRKWLNQWPGLLEGSVWIEGRKVKEYPAALPKLLHFRRNCRRMERWFDKIAHCPCIEKRQLDCHGVVDCTMTLHTTSMCVKSWEQRSHV